MKKTLILFVIFTIVFSCSQKIQEKELINSENIKFTEFKEKDYELYLPNKKINGVLILFGGYNEKTEDIKKEFPILEDARKQNIAVIFSKFNKRLWLEESEKYKLANRLQYIIVEHKLPIDNIYIGGFSSGGNVSLIISNFIVGMKQFYIDPKGVFIVDSPIDLVALYKSSSKNIEHNFSEPSVQESKWLLENLGNNFGNPEDNIYNYEKNAVYTYSTNNTSNLKKLKRTKIRLYTEPDTLWWKENRMADYKQINAFYIKKLAESLNKRDFESVEYINTTAKGFRSNGQRHPHSWSIVDKEDLISWMIK